MMIDSHCHAWRTWPYTQPVPDPRTRGRAEQLLYEMNANGVDKALIVSAQIDNNATNNAYVAQMVTQHPARFFQLADLDSSWSPGYHRPGGARRLDRMAQRWKIVGFTHYLAKDEDGSWLAGPDGVAIFQKAADLRLMASLSCYPHQLKSIRRVAERFPQVPVLLHHLGHPAMGRGSMEENLGEILKCAALNNIYIKLSGFAYASPDQTWDYPYPAVQDLVKAEYEHFGPQRMCWGSDYPVVTQFMTYRQSLEVFRAHCDFVPPQEQKWVLGETLAGLLKHTL